MKKAYIKILSITLLLVSVLGCKKDFFELEDPNGIDDAIWNDEGAVNLYLYKGYDLMMPTWPVPGAIHNTSDELNNANTAFLYGTLTESSVTDIGTANNNVTATRYADIRRCNTAIDGMNAGSLPDAVRNPLKGQFFFLRAFVYFRLVSIYGGVPLVLHPQSLSDESLDVPRSKTSECITQIVKDLDSAIAYLPKTWPAAEKGKVPQAAALAFKGKVLMYWASPQFNPTGISSRWEDAYIAAKAAYDSCVAQGYQLYSNYANIFVDESSANKEILLVRNLDATSVSPARGTNNEHITRARSETNGLAGGGSNQPTVQLVNAYTMKDGLPISQSSVTFPYNSTLFWQNRDPRFDMSIAYNGGIWPLSSKAGRKQWNYQGVTDESGGLTATGFYCKRICNPNLPAVQTLYNSNTGGGSGMDWIEIRFAEVIMNLAECANETGRLTEAKDMVRRIRQRAGIVAGASDYGMAIATDMVTMRSLIMNERMVEFAMEGKRYWDLRRTRTLHLLTGTVRTGTRWTPKSPWTVATLEALTASGIKRRDTADLNNITTYNAMFTLSSVSLDPTTPINIPQTYYFYALPPNFLGSSYLLQQTNGWSGGTFDPLQ